MRAITGPLKAGIYIGQVVDYPGEYGTVNDDASKPALTGNLQSDSVKWNFERTGDDLFRIRHLCTNTLPLILPGKDMAVGMGMEGAGELIIKETDVKGEYSVAPAQHPSLFYSATKVQGELQANVGSKMTRVRFFYADN
ncbi:hypothetical protein APHAL10511_002893 [Amanita phalloides]|nr:hypothetical protein APHAL10511_002893 [Amanita phalloides]